MLHIQLLGQFLVLLYITSVKLNENKYSEMSFASKNTQGKRRLMY